MIARPLPPHPVTKDIPPRVLQEIPAPQGAQENTIPWVLGAAQVSDHLPAITDRLKNRQLIVLPTDTVYGIGAVPFDPAAVQAVLDAKQRSQDFPPPVLVPHWEWIAKLTDPACPHQLDQATALAKIFWPGALTIIVPARPDLGWDLGRTGGTMALRHPAQTITEQILAAAGPLAVTSANLHTQPPATTVEQAEEYFGARVQIYIDAGHCGSDVSSTIVALEQNSTGPGYRIIRHGSISEEQIRQVLG